MTVHWADVDPDDITRLYGGEWEPAWQPPATTDLPDISEWDGTMPDTTPNMIHAPWTPEEVAGPAETIARLRAELDDVTRKRDEWQWRTEDAQRQTRCQRERAEQAEAEVARMRYFVASCGEDGHAVRTAALALQRAEEAEKAITRVTAELDAADRMLGTDGPTFRTAAGARIMAGRIRAALEAPADNTKPTACGCPEAPEADRELDRRIAALDTVPVPRAAFDQLVAVARHVSLGRGAAFLTPYPDAVARRALGALDDAGLLNAGEQQ